MATIDQLKEALVAAHEAGNEDHAAIIAEEISRMQSGQKQQAAKVPSQVQTEEPSILEQMRKGTIPERIKAGTILYPDEEAMLRKTLQGAASGPLMGLVQAGASMLGNTELSEKIAKNQREGNLVGSMMQPEAWLVGGAIPNLAKWWQRGLAGATAGGLFGASAATPQVEDQLGQRSTSAALGATIGGAIPAVSALGKASIGSVTDTTGAALGKQSAIDKLASDAARRFAGKDSAFIESAIQNRTQAIPGVTPTVADVLGEANLRQSAQTGGSTVRLQKTLSGAPGMEDVLPSAVKENKAAIEAFTEGVERSLAPVRNSILRIANKTGIDSNQVVSQINTKLNTPGDREADMVKAVLPKIIDKIDSMKQSAPGIVDSRDIYALRKNLAGTIKNLAKETGTWDKKLAASLTRDVQLMIDGAIDNAVGSNRWSNGYMRVYADKMADVRKYQTTVEAGKDIAKQVKSSGMSSVTTGDVPQIPNILSRPITVINYALKKVLGDANTPVARELARRMSNPDEYAKLLALPKGNPTRELVEKVLAVSSGELVQEGDQ